MKKSILLLCAALPVVLLTGCNTVSCPEWSEFWQSTYDNGNVESQWCFQIDSDVMEWHWTYFYENGWKEMEWDISNDLSQWKWTFYDEDGKNIVIMEWTYKDGIEDWEWKYFDDNWKYICSDIYENGELTDEWSCEISVED